MINPNFDGYFLDGSEKKVNGTLVSSPLFVRNDDNSSTFIGSTFFIARNGVMITAKHCLFDNQNVVLKNLFIVQITSEDNYVIRPIKRIYWNNSDVALLIPVGMSSNVTGNPLWNPVIPITNNKVGIGERIASFAWPLTKIYPNKEGEKLSLDIKWHYGEIEDYHENGYSFLKHSCYQSSMHIDGGSSGGLVTTSGGAVFAINSTGADVSDDLSPYSFLSPVSHCFDIEIEADDGKWYSVKKLIELKQIPFIGNLLPK